MPKPPKCYLYAVAAPGIRCDLGVLAGVAPAGETPSRVETVDAGPFAVVVSPFSAPHVRPDRRNLSAHQGTLRALLAADVPFLPAAFGILAPSRTALVKSLYPRRAEIDAELGRLADAREMGVRVAWESGNLFEMFVQRYPELARMRDDLWARPGGPSRDEKIEMGRAFEGALARSREAHEAAVRRALAPCVREFHARPPRDETVALDLACLVDRGQEEEFDRTVRGTARLLDKACTVHVGGPWPPYHFVRLSLEETRA